MDFFSGQVFKLYCATCVKRKDKYFVVALVDPVLRCFVINSELTALQASKPELKRECVRLTRAQHTFLHHDSYLGCNQLFQEYTSKALNLVLAHSPGAFVGTLHADSMAEAWRRFPYNISLPRKRIDELLVAWKPIQG